MASRNLDIFLSNSSYKRPVDIKKLKFIYESINEYSLEKDKDFKEIKILEVGCGDGGITFPVASLGCNVRSFDVDKESVDLVNNKINENCIKNVNVTVDDGFTFVDMNSYDIIIISEVLEHVLEPKKFINNITKEIKRGSYLILTCPNGYGPWELRNKPYYYIFRNNKLRKLLSKSPYILGTGPDHCQFYKKRDIMKFFSNSFELRNCRNSDSILAIFDVLLKGEKLNKIVGDVDIALADILPYQFVSGWYFLFEMK